MKIIVPLLSAVLVCLSTARHALETTMQSALIDNECCRRTDVCSNALYPYDIPSLDLSDGSITGSIIDGKIDASSDEYSRFLELPMYSGEKDGGNDRIGTAYIAYDCSNNMVCAAAHLDNSFIETNPTIQVDQADDASWIQFGEHHGALTLIASKSDELAYVSQPDNNGLIIGYEGCWSVYALAGIQSIVNNYVNIRFSNNNEVVSTAIPESSWQNVCLTTTCEELVSPSNIRSIRIESTTGEMIQMFQLQAYTSSGVEVASGKTARQSSTWKDNDARFGASLALQNNNRFSHTHADDRRAIFEVDLEETHEIRYVVIRNRYCGGSADSAGCLCRLSRAAISLIDGTGSVVSSIQLENTCNQLILHNDFARASRSM